MTKWPSGKFIPVCKIQGRLAINNKVAKKEARGPIQ